VEIRELISSQRTEWDDRRDGTLEWGTDWGTAVTANRTAGQFVGPFEVISGTHKVTTDTHDGKTVKVIENVVAGVDVVSASNMRLAPSDMAYGTWRLMLNKAESSTINVGLVSQNPLAPAAGDYSLEIDAAEAITLVIPGGATVITGSTTATVGVYQEYWVTRSPAGVWILYLDGTSIGTGTDNTITTGNYLTFDSDAGDKRILSNISADYSIMKFQGVVAP
jgi:hypothetical protein